jgi:hypothetical protein
MALRGHTEDYGLADALQLIQKAGKSGMLRCENAADDVRLLIENGWILSAETAGRPNDAQLGSRLLRAGVITSSELGTALARRARTSEPITEILLDAGLATVETLKQFATMMATDTLFDVFTWAQGTYEFHEGAIQAPRTFVQAISLDDMLMQGIVIMDEWPRIQARIPSDSQVVDRRWAVPPETEPSVEALFGGFGEDAPAAPPKAGRVEIGDHERIIHDLAVPGIDVQTIIDRSPFHRLETLRCLSVLIGEHYTRLRDP